MTTAKEALLPCPFCGKSEFVRVGSCHENEDDVRHSEMWDIVCDASASSGLDGGAKLVGCGASGGYHASVHRATTAWNRRARAAAEPEGWVSEVAWLVEIKTGWGTGNYWGNSGWDLGWVTIDRAIRFSRKEDAESVIVHLRSEDRKYSRHADPDLYFAAQHEWCGTLPAPPECTAAQVARKAEPSKEDSGPASAVPDEGPWCDMCGAWAGHDTRHHDNLAAAPTEPAPQQAEAFYRTPDGGLIFHARKSSETAAPAGMPEEPIVYQMNDPHTMAPGRYWDMVHSHSYDALRAHAEQLQHESAQRLEDHNSQQRVAIKMQERAEKAEAELLIRTDNYEYQRQRADHLQRENEALSANQCLHGILGDEYGHAYCPKINELQREVKTWKELAERAEAELALIRPVAEAAEKWATIAGDGSPLASAIAKWRGKT